MRKRNNWNDFCGKKYDSMMGRCYRPTDNSYRTYAARGIRVCTEWIRDISAFKLWMEAELIRLGVTKEEVLANRKLYTLDRIDNNGHYTPQNCRLCDYQTQGRNTRSRNKIKIISAEGDEIEV